MKKILTILIFISTSCFSQTWEWAERFGHSGGNDVGSNISTDKNGNSYVCGAFGDTIVFGTTTLYSSGGWDTYFTKIDSSGNVLWALSYGGAGIDIAWDVVPDSIGNCYVFGNFSDTINIGGYTLTSSGSTDVFIAKIDSNLNVVWAKKGGGSGTDEAWSIRLDKWNNVYVTLAFKATAYFDTDSLVSAGDLDVALVKYDNNGNEIWSKKAGGTGMDSPAIVTFDESGFTYVSGLFSNTAFFGNFSVSSVSLYDLFIAKYDTAGTVLWVRSSSSTGGVGNSVMRVGKNNDIFVAGNFSGTVNLGSLSLTSTGNSDVYISKCDSTGKFIWATQISSVVADLVYGITIDEKNNIYATGLYGSNAMFGSVAVTGDYDIYVTKIDSSGNVQWVKTANGPGLEWGYGIAESNNNIYCTGFFETDLSFDNSSLLISSAGNDDIYVAKISQVPTGINDLNVFVNPVAIYPNPAITTCTITAPAFLNSELFIYDITGRVLTQQTFNEQAAINVSQLKAGLYLVEIRDKAGKNVKGKLLHQL